MVNVFLIDDRGALKSSSLHSTWTSVITEFLSLLEFGRAGHFVNMSVIVSTSLEYECIVLLGIGNPSSDDFFLS